MTPSSFTSVEHLPQAVVVHVLPASLGKVEVDGICDGVDAARVTAPALPFIIDMAKVGYAGSLALGVLVGLTKEFQNRRQRLIFVNLQPTTQQAFQLTQLHRIMEIMPNVPAAMASIEGGAS
jgi:anti-anti-sigma factor